MSQGRMNRIKHEAFPNGEANVLTDRLDELKTKN